MKPLALILLFLTGCAAPIGRLNPGASIPYIIAPEAELRAISQTSAAYNLLGLTDGDRIMESYCGGDAAVAAHEAAHLSEIRGITYRQAIDLLTPPNHNEHMRKRLASMHKIADMGGDPWQALKDVYGPDAVGHPEILARLK